MAIKIYEASTEELITCERLMFWAYLSIAPRENIGTYHKCILNELADRFTSEEPYCDSLDQRHVFHKRITKLGALRGLLPGLFLSETMRHVWGRVIFQHLGVKLNFKGQNLKPSSLPVFMLPLTCVCCGQKLSNLNSDNYSTQQKWKCSEDDKSTYRDCEKAWGIMKATFEKAINALIQLGALPVDERDSFLIECLPIILSAYHLLSTHLQEYDLSIRPYIPRYSLVSDYQNIDYSWFVPYLIYDGTTVTEETYQPMFKKDIIGKTIVAIETENGSPYVGEMDVQANDNLITISQLKGFLIKKPSLVATTTT